MRVVLASLAMMATGLLFQAEQANAQILFKYGTKSASSVGFMRAFEKNPGSGNRKQAMEEYLPLYINYVLKVQDAYDMRLDTLEGQQEELMGYKNQLAASFLDEKAGIEGLTDEAILRMQEDVLLGHIYIEYLQGDTAAAIKKADEAIKKLKAGTKWETVAETFSTDPDLKRQGGVLGWISPFVIPYTYETQVYALPKGGYTNPIRASQGIHIFSKRNSRPGSGTVQVAQILLADIPGWTDEQRKERSRLADSLYNLLNAGANFEQLVAAYSEDRSTKYSAGVMPPFGAGSFDPVFEEQAFALKTPGALSKPFATAFGWHILKLVAKIPSPGKDDAEARSQVKQKIVAEGRTEGAKSAYIKSHLQAMKYKAGPVTPAQLQVFTDSLLKNGTTTGKGITEKTVLFSFARQTVTISDWVAFARVQQMAGSLQEGDKIDPFYNDFLMNKASEYLAAHLDEIDPQFKVQFKEFKDANLLFEAMERNVWEKATNDSVSLKKYYESHKDKYRWEENVVGIVVTGNDSSMVQSARTRLAADPSQWRLLNESSGGQLFADSARFESASFPWNNTGNFTPGTCTPIQKNQLDASFSFACIIETGKAGMPRSFEDARGYVVSDYQQVLENQWIARLKKKYPVVMNDAEWKKLLAQAGK